MSILSEMWNGADYSERKNRKQVLHLVKNSIPTAYLLPREDLFVITLAKKYTLPTNMELIIVREYYMDTDLEINKINPLDVIRRMEVYTPKNAEFDITYGKFYIRKYKLTLRQMDMGKNVFENSVLINYNYTDHEFISKLDNLIKTYMNSSVFSDLYNKYGYSPV
jgi:hypothetical protein